jgi:hypothetical protein
MYAYLSLTSGSQPRLEGSGASPPASQKIDVACTLPVIVCFPLDHSLHPLCQRNFHLLPICSSILDRLESFRPVPVEHSPPRVRESPRCFRSCFSSPSTVESESSEPPGELFLSFLTSFQRALYKWIGNWTRDPHQFKERPPFPGGRRRDDCSTLSGGLEMVIWFNPQMGVADTIMTCKQGVVDLI